MIGHGPESVHELSLGGAQKLDDRWGGAGRLGFGLARYLVGHGSVPHQTQPFPADAGAGSGDERHQRLVALRPGAGDAKGLERSEEHTSELQSLMRISYAGFCLNKKTSTANQKHFINLILKSI